MHATHVVFPYDPKRPQNTFSTADCATIIQTARTAAAVDAEVMLHRGHAHQREASSALSRAIRKAKVHKLVPTDATVWIYERLYQMIDYANMRHWQFDISGIFAPLQVLRYQQGGHYQWHVDAGGGSTSDRKISITIQLSAPRSYVGGDLALIVGPKVMKMRRDQGAVILFPSYSLHQVTAVTKGERWALVAWVQGPPFR